MVDILQVLEGAAYVGFIAGAIFAVLELRSISRNRKIEMSMRLGELWVSRDFVEALAKWDKTDFQTAETAEKTCPKADLVMMAELFNYAASLARNKYVSKEFAMREFDFEYPWSKMEPWCLDWRRRTAPDELKAFEWMANEQRKRRLAEEQRRKGA